MDFFNVVVIEHHIKLYINEKRKPCTSITQYNFYFERSAKIGQNRPFPLVTCACSLLCDADSDGMIVYQDNIGACLRRRNVGYSLMNILYSPVIKANMNYRHIFLSNLYLKRVFARCKSWLISFALAYWSCEERKRVLQNEKLLLTVGSEPPTFRL